ncbi:hypothetical protein DPMN_025161 [Dreissena polymorpha]|uniref:Uncharacterized protein n=1 Tax=Dreissena polymorpha TaxID=45954 RepID=A0A9D4LQ94_DREPO|nr:hypothetical protein DPMN_025161 [Dreissena polymorpha]
MHIIPSRHDKRCTRVKLLRIGRRNTENQRCCSATVYEINSVKERWWRVAVNNRSTFLSPVS